MIIIAAPMSHRFKIYYKTAIINICWVLALLVLIIIFLLVYGLHNLPDGKLLIDSITNFSTILSIVLSISSILFAFFTSHDTSMQYRSMEKALEEVRATNKHMAENNAILLQQVRDLSIGINTINVRMENTSKSNTTSYSNAGLESPNSQIKSNVKKLH